MTTKERFHKTLDFINPGDRLPVFEWAPWWDKTVDRWKTEGLDAAMPYEAVAGHLNLDRIEHVGCGPITDNAWSRKIQGFGQPFIRSESEYDSFLNDLYTDGQVDKAINIIKSLKDGHDRGEYPIMFGLNGFFWHTRDMFGIEPQFYAFYDCPELIHRMSRNLCEFYKRVLSQAFELMTPLCVYLSEDMSYKSGPMLSKAMFDEFIKPYYLEVGEIIKQAGSKFMVDSDGNVHDMIPWMVESGVEGMCPFERNAGNDICKIREQYPDFLMYGGYDKLVMNKGEAAIRAEFERILPVMRSGGYLASVDHQTPPAVSLSDYMIWMRVFREYAELAAEQWRRPN